MSKLIKSHHPSAEVLGNPTPPRTGAFEVTIDGEPVYSKFETGNFPTDAEVRGWFE